MGRFQKKLEDKANDLAATTTNRNWEASIPAMLSREIALTLDQIHRQREFHENELRQLLRMECSVGTDLMQLQQRIPRYTPYHFPEKEKLKQRLFEIERERRKLSLRLQDKTQSLEDRLLSLINKWQQLDQ